MRPEATVVCAERTSIADPSGFLSALMRWYRASGRHNLPWRLTRDPYAVLVSEVMLQQTQVERVLPYYETWLKRWPTAASLAQASVGDVIRAWGGLGYNRRAVNLQRAAVAIEAAGGQFPRGLRSLMALPGIGPYTASAVTSFAFGQGVPVADTNIARVLARFVHGIASRRDIPLAQVAATAHSLLPERAIRDHNLALMDLGALICTSRRPGCEACPVKSECAWRGAGYPSSTASLKRAPRFEGTARFARGRIIEALCNAESLSAGELSARLPAEHRAHAPSYLAALQRDQLVEQTDSGDWRLPSATAG